MDVYLGFVLLPTFLGNSKSDLCNTTLRIWLLQYSGIVQDELGFAFYSSRDLVILHADPIGRDVTCVLQNETRKFCLDDREVIG